MFGGSSSSSSPFSNQLLFGTPAPPSTPLFSTPASSSTSSFSTPSSMPAFGASSPFPSFGAASTPPPPFPSGYGSSLFSTPFTPQQQFQTPGFSSPLHVPQTSQFFQPQFPNSQLTTQMAPVAPLPFSFADRDIQLILEAYREENGNSKYAFKHLLFNVTEPQFRMKPSGVSDIMWTEALGKMEGMEKENRERLWPQLVQGFKDLSQRLKVQDEVVVSDVERLKMTQNNVKLLQRHFQADTLPWVQRLKQKEQLLQRRLLRIMRIVEGLESKDCRVPLTKAEVELAEKLASITRQIRRSEDGLSKRSYNLLTMSHVESNANMGKNSACLSGSMNIHEQSLIDMQEVVQQQTEAIGRLGNVLKRDMRDAQILTEEEDSEMAD